ncbi:MAG: hypothetical protein WBV94_07510 [Blastocatellia bacterium]
MSVLSLSFSVAGFPTSRDASEEVKSVFLVALIVTLIEPLTIADAASF